MNVVETPHTSAIAKPYKGPESYQVEDFDFFFGRDAETDQIIARVLANRLTLLHAQSGAGKTSLLNARVIPGLEKRGWSAYRILPQNDPIESIRAATFQYILPDPRAELLALERAWTALIPDKQDVALKMLLLAYDNLEIRDPLRRGLVAQVKTAGPEKPSNDPIACDPYFNRLLRACIEVDTFGEHLGALQQAAHGGAGSLINITEGMYVSDLRRVLLDPLFLSSYNKLVNELKVPGRDLRVFFEHLVETYGRRRTRFGLILVLDQFEEIFTRFIDPGVTAVDYLSELPDWRLRWEFFDQLETLYGEKPAFNEQNSDGDLSRTLPIRYVISMRDEYIAQLDPLRRFANQLEDSFYHLKLLDKDQATSAIKEPARIFGYTYEANCFERIIQQLTKEDRYVEPAHLQLVCDKLWNEKGHELATTGDKDEQQVRVIKENVFRDLGETKGILKSFFTDFLTGLDQASMRETLEILEPLVTANGTRNIIERDRLINVPLHDGRRRRELLDSLVNHTIVRTEPRLGGYFVEITHEFLITPILDAINTALNKDSEYKGYRLALRTLERLYGSNLAGNTPPLSQQEFYTLHRHRAAIRWDAWSYELMLRCAIAYGAMADILLEYWKAFEKAFATLPAMSVDSAIDKALRQEPTLLSLAELRFVDNEKESHHRLRKDQTEVIWRSALNWSTNDERDVIEYWTKRMNSYD